MSGVESKDENVTILQIVNRIEETIYKKQLISSSFSLFGSAGPELGRTIKNLSTGKAENKILLTISGGQDSIFLLFCFSLLQSQLSLSFRVVWCNHFWQIDSFYTTLHLTKSTLAFSSSIIGFIPLHLVSKDDKLFCFKEHDALLSKRAKKKLDFLSALLLLLLYTRLGSQNLSMPLTPISLVFTRLDSPNFWCLCCAHTFGEWKKICSGRVTPLPIKKSKIFCSFGTKDWFGFAGKTSPEQILDLQRHVTQAKPNPRHREILSRMSVRFFCKQNKESKIFCSFRTKELEINPEHGKGTQKYFTQKFWLFPRKESRAKRNRVITCRFKAKLFLREETKQKTKALKNAFGFDTKRQYSETRARNWRHIIIERSSTFYDSNQCVYGHTLTDRVETILFNLIRSSGPRGITCLARKREHSRFCYNKFYPCLEQIKKTTHIDHF